MAVKQTADLLIPLANFYTRNGLDREDRHACHAFIQDAFPGQNIEEAACQGYCSLTFFVGDEVIVQFRPRQYKLNHRVAHAAQEVYGRFAPRTTYVTTLPKPALLVYSMNRLPGVSYQDFRASNASLANSTVARATLCKDFAAFLAIGWQRRECIPLPLGIVGSSLRSRLELLCKDLPHRFQPTAKRILKNIRQIELLPRVLTHGDITPSNIIINPLTHHLIGLVDWAEAEPLPFGTCLYGLEEILGEITEMNFHYHPKATYLRNVFWAELTTQVSELKQDGLMRAVRLARDLGVLLWHGIAWDDGAINRVVSESRGEDESEIRRLDAFLDTEIHDGIQCVSQMAVENASKL
ncbi:hypothetical protein DSL72_007661 [Monilinia vaccinii-corymbosi]|uniref:Aminoglycoside phosphotransferase domain-containing protein n=1 Tax=Monilinia vaccinii-corymbosi TaxID=61207 RepID=A0A8A3PIE6_9HELO|nr:hypothetical protein DSL72_007661 [Monilinia vaccinii-corymbosi]